MKSISTFILLVTCLFGYAQVTNEGTPKSWDLRNDTGLAPIVMPGFDLAKLQQEDAVNDLKKQGPWRFGHEFIVDYNLANSGKWETLENGDRVWRIRFYSEGAKSMNFIFSDFYLPDGSTLYLYNNDKTDLLGAYDSKQNNADRILGTWMVQGQDIWIEYYEPKAEKGQGKLELYKLIHGYRGADEFVAKSLGDSGNCMYDVDCDMGAIDATKNINKKAVAMVMMGGGLCSGAMINNVTNDGTPYFLTANHCYEGALETGDLPPSWSFRFNWISPTPVCAVFGNSANDTQIYTVGNAQLRARYAQTDVCLVEIMGLLNPAWDIVWAGWDRNTTAPASVYGIHHPSGDIMKVSLDNQPPTPVTEMLGGVSTMAWRVNGWQKGVTEGGSSGSPLFNNQGMIIGQLWGGGSDCNGFGPNTNPDYYGRFDKSWSTGPSAASRLRDWLDPNNTNAMSVTYHAPNMGVADVVPANEVKVYPNPSNGIFNVSLGDAFEMSYEVYNILGQTVKSGKLTTDNNTVNLTNSQEGVYILKLTDAANNRSVTRKIVKE